MAAQQGREAGPRSLAQRARSRGHCPHTPRTGVTLTEGTNGEGSSWGKANLAWALGRLGAKASCGLGTGRAWRHLPLTLKTAPVERVPREKAAIGKYCCPRTPWQVGGCAPRNHGHPRDLESGQPWGEAVVPGPGPPWVPSPPHVLHTAGLQMVSPGAGVKQHPGQIPLTSKERAAPGGHREDRVARRAVAG